MCVTLWVWLCRVRGSAWEWLHGCGSAWVWLPVGVTAWVWLHGCDSAWQWLHGCGSGCDSSWVWLCMGVTLHGCDSPWVWLHGCDSAWVWLPVGVALHVSNSAWVCGSEWDGTLLPLLHLFSPQRYRSWNFILAFSLIMLGLQKTQNAKRNGHNCLALFDFHSEGKMSHTFNYYQLNTINEWEACGLAVMAL